MPIWLSSIGWRVKLLVALGLLCYLFHISNKINSSCSLQKLSQHLCETNQYESQHQAHFVAMSIIKALHKHN